MQKRRPPLGRALRFVRLAVVAIASLSLFGSLLPFPPTIKAAGTPFTDIGTSEFIPDIEWLYGSGVTHGCNQEVTHFCPTVTVSREQMASFLVRALDLPPTTTDYFVDDTGSMHEADINRLYKAGITSGCGTDEVPGGPPNLLFCPTLDVTREQMASFIARALDLPQPAPGTDHFDDDDGNLFHENDINRMADAAITLGCGGRNYCPGSPVTREQMAAFLHRAFISTRLLYVAATGDDGNPGTHSAPKLTVGAAVSAAALAGVREIHVGMATDIPSGRIPALAAVAQEANLGGLDRVVLDPPVYVTPEPNSAAGYILHPNLEAIRELGERIFASPTASTTP